MSSHGSDWHACCGALWVRVKGKGHIRGLLTESMEYECETLSRDSLWGFVMQLDAQMEDARLPIAL